MTYLEQLREHQRENFEELEERMILNQTSQIPRGSPLPPCPECRETPRHVAIEPPRPRGIRAELTITMEPCGHTVVEQLP